MGKDDNKVLDIMKKSSALLDGHFLLTSGLHSNRYFQCALVMQYPNYAAFIAGELAKKFGKKKIDVVVSPAIGGIVIGQEIARALKARAVFTEREEGTMTLRRGFDIRKNEKVLAVEDVLTTGGSIREIIRMVKEKKGKLVGVGSIVNRSTKKLDFGVPIESIIRLKVETFDAQHCPFCKKGVPLVKPGSRKFK